MAVFLSVVLGGCAGNSEPPLRQEGVASPATEAPAQPPAVSGSVEAATKQASDGRSVTISKAVVDGAPGFVVVHAEDKGGAGLVIGHAAIEEGTSTDLVVPLDEKVATGAYWAMLHRDAGRVGAFEWPGPDGPVRAPVGIAYVQTKINLTVV